jgi:hypothetical protein
MTAYLFLFHSTVGVVQTRKPCRPAGLPFRSKIFRASCARLRSVWIEGTEDAARLDNRGAYGGAVSAEWGSVAVHRQLPAKD